MANPDGRVEAGREVRLTRRALTLAAAAALIGLTFGPRIGLSVLGGATVSMLNILVLRRVVGGLSGIQSARSAIALAALTGVRYLLLGGVLVAIIAVWNADVIGVVCGLGAPNLAVLLELRNGGFTALRTPPASPPPDDPEDRENLSQGA
ncbi:MAG: ATP synthase subunit I [Acidobacteria bacterium]|nr:ATP synthase subunit I [Acidobacteriota bacterium]